MTQCTTYSQNQFASVIRSINRELEEKGHLGDSNEGAQVPEDSTSTTTRALVDQRQLLTEMRAQNFDVIRFATYRTACKLRFIQKRTNLHLVDIWNMIEAFRENGLNSLDNSAPVDVNRIDTLLSSVYYHLNKRLPMSSQISADESTSLLISWLQRAFDVERRGRFRVLSIKVSLAILCSGKLMDKLRYVFTLVSDVSGSMVWTRFEEFLKEVLLLPTGVFEGPSFGYNETASRACFNGRSKVTVNDFLDVLMSDPGPQCLMWLPILHRMATIENVFHPVQCEGCNRESFMGFRYKCQRCYNYHMCQDCFWRGRTTGNHSNDHAMKEYSSYKSPAKQIGHSLRKSFRCKPVKSSSRIPQFPETPEKVLDLAHIVPATPVPAHNGFPDGTMHSQRSVDLSSLDSGTSNRSPSKYAHSSIDSTRMDDEHRLIARYAARLAADTNNAARSPAELHFSLDANQEHLELIAQLEVKNREIMLEIQKLKKEQELQAAAGQEAHHQRNPTLLAELRLLRQRRDELEARMSALQESRRELMVQLEGLMKLLKSQGSPRSTPNSSPRSRTGHSPPVAATHGSSPSTPGDSFSGVGAEMRQAFGTPGSTGSSGNNLRSLRNDLLIAADSVTNAMSSLVKELNSEASSASEEEDDDDIPKARAHSLQAGPPEDINMWREEIQRRLQEESRFIAELRSRKSRANGRHYSSDTDQERYMSTDEGEGSYVRSDESFLNTDEAESYVKTDDESIMKTDDEEMVEIYTQAKDLLQYHTRYTTDDESCLETDQESYIRTDDEEGGNTEWEEAMKRWVNR